MAHEPPKLKIYIPSNSAKPDKLFKKELIKIILNLIQEIAREYSKTKCIKLNTINKDIQNLDDNHKS